MRPQFLDQHSFWTRTPHYDQSRADYASPVTVYRHERSWRLSDAVIAALLVGVIAAISVGLL